MSAVQYHRVKNTLNYKDRNWLVKNYTKVRASMPRPDDLEIYKYIKRCNGRTVYDIAVKLGRKESDVVSGIRRLAVAGYINRSDSSVPRKHVYTVNKGD